MTTNLHLTENPSSPPMIEDQHGRLWGFLYHDTPSGLLKIGGCYRNFLGLVDDRFATANEALAAAQSWCDTAIGRAAETTAE